jgi:hypothetical protein
MEVAQGEKIENSRVRDILGLLVRANTSANEKERLSDEEVLARELLLYPQKLFSSLIHH